MWLMSCRRQRKLTQGPAPDPKCKLIILSFFTLPHVLDCLICSRKSMSILMVLQIMWGWDRWQLIHLYYGVGGRTKGGYHLIAFFSSCASVFCCLMFPIPLFRWLEHDGCCVYFFGFFFICFVSGSFN